MGSTMWPAEFPGLEQLDRLLRCGICYEYFNTALMTGCSHNYCSLCIRKSIGYRTECPTCMKETFESHLRSNRILDDIVTLYLGFKSKLVSVLLHKQINIPWNEVPSVHKHVTDDGNKASSSSKQVNCVLSEPEVMEVTEEKLHCELFNKEIISNPNVKEISNSDLRKVVTPQKIISSQFNGRGPSTSKSSIKIPPMFSPKKSIQHSEPLVKKVACPVCNVDIPEKNINFHLDSCLKHEEPVTNRNNPCETRKPLIKPLYNLLKQADLKKKLKEYGLNFIGSRDALIKRLQRFILLYNAECDSLKPRTVAEIVRQVEREEQEEKKISAPPKVLMFPKNDTEKSDDIRREYLQKNKSSFEDLIQKVKQQRQQKQVLHNTTTVTVIDNEAKSVGASERKIMHNHIKHQSNDYVCSSTASIGEELGILNNSFRKCPRKLDYSDDEQDAQLETTLPSASSVDHITCLTNSQDKKISISTDDICGNSECLSPNVNTPVKFDRNNDATSSSMTDSQILNEKVSPVLASRSSAKKLRSEEAEVHASPDIFMDDMCENCGLRTFETSDNESEKSVSLLEYDENNIALAGVGQITYQPNHEIMSNNSNAKDVQHVEVEELGISPLHSSPEENMLYIPHKRNKRRTLHTTEKEATDRVLRKRTKR